MAIPIPVEARIASTSRIPGSSTPATSANITNAGQASGGGGNPNPLANTAVIAAFASLLASALVLGVVVAAMLLHRRQKRQENALAAAELPRDSQPKNVTAQTAVAQPVASTSPAPSRVATTASIPSSSDPVPSPPEKNDSSLFPRYPPPVSHLADTKLAPSRGIFDGVEHRSSENEVFESRTSAGAVIKANAAARERVRGMSCTEVKERLLEFGLADGLARLLEDNGIDGPRLLELDAFQLQSLGVTSRGSRTLVLQTVEIMLEHVRDGLMGGGEGGVGPSGQGSNIPRGDGIDAPPQYA
ncbi:hypothetical protein HDU96_011051 [Phlyctochytrium bullatum]|nr:hypothetical protein HDU96_011051 [Phlyctochytrium bullatum]